MICFAKPGLREDLYIAHKKEFSKTCYMSNTYTWERRSLFIIDNPVLWLERMLNKDYYRNGSKEKEKTLVSLKRLGAKMN
jgi:hypothetical protein